MVEPVLAGVGVNVEQRVKPSVDFGPRRLMVSERVKLLTRSDTRCETEREESQYDSDWDGAFKQPQ